MPEKLSKLELRTRIRNEFLAGKMGEDSWESARITLDRIMRHGLENDPQWADFVTMLKDLNEIDPNSAAPLAQIKSHKRNLNRDNVPNMGPYTSEELLSNPRQFEEQLSHNPRKFEGEAA